VRGTSETCRIRYAVSGGEFTDWILLYNFPWELMGIDVERNTYIEVELDSTSYNGYFRLSVFANDQYYSVVTDGPYDTVRLRVLVE
jgi:hypothetical protein